jgi:hypothetical protein
MSNIYLERKKREGGWRARQNGEVIAEGGTQNDVGIAARRVNPDDPILAERVELASCESGEGTTGHNPLTLAIVPFYNLNRIRGMAAKTTHIIPRDGGWIVKKEPAKEPARFFVERRGDQWAVKRPGAKRASAVYATQKEAIDAARKTVLRSSAGQIVVHNRNGSIRWRDLHGLPAVQRPPRRSQLGTKAIERAVSTVIRERLERD